MRYGPQTPGTGGPPGGGAQTGLNQPGRRAPAGPALTMGRSQEDAGGVLERPRPGRAGGASPAPMPGRPRFSMTPGLAACGYVVPVGGNPDVGARTRTERGCNPGPTSGCLPKNDNPRLHARRLLAAQRPGATPVAVQGPLLEPGGSTFRTCGSPTAQVSA